MAWEEEEEEGAAGGGGQRGALRYAVGDEIEVRMNGSGFHGAYFEATVSAHLRGAAGVGEYEVLFAALVEEGSGGPLREAASPADVRPRPPSVAAGAGCEFNLFDLVEAYQRDGWWPGVVSAAWPGDGDEPPRYAVSFPSCGVGEVEVLPASLVRPRRVFSRGRWMDAREVVPRVPQYDEGSNVEVTLDQGKRQRTAWMPATIVKTISCNNYVVRLGDAKGSIEVLDCCYIRPQPIFDTMKFEYELEPSTKVEVYRNGAWSPGVITDIGSCESGRYEVRVKGHDSGDEEDYMVVSSALVKPCYEWDGHEWTPCKIKKPARKRNYRACNLNLSLVPSTPGEDSDQYIISVPNKRVRTNKIKDEDSLHPRQDKDGSLLRNGLHVKAPLHKNTTRGMKQECKNEAKGKASMLASSELPKLKWTQSGCKRRHFSTKALAGRTLDHVCISTPKDAVKINGKSGYGDIIEISDNSGYGDIIEISDNSSCNPRRKQTRRNSPNDELHFQHFVHPKQESQSTLHFQHLVHPKQESQSALHFQHLVHPKQESQSTLHFKHLVHPKQESQSTLHFKHLVHPKQESQSTVSMSPKQSPLNHDTLLAATTHCHVLTTPLSLLEIPQTPSNNNDGQPILLVCHPILEKQQVQELPGMNETNETAVSDHVHSEADLLAPDDCTAGDQNHVMCLEVTEGKSCGADTCIKEADNSSITSQNSMQTIVEGSYGEDNSMRQRSGNSEVPFSSKSGPYSSEQQGAKAVLSCTPMLSNSTVHAVPLVPINAFQLVSPNEMEVPETHKNTPDAMEINKIICLSHQEQAHCHLEISMNSAKKIDDVSLRECKPLSRHPLGSLGQCEVTIPWNLVGPSSFVNPGITMNLSTIMPTPDSTTLPPAFSTNLLMGHHDKMEVFEKLPQEPHFSQLKDFPLEFREGKSLGLMASFANIAESIRNMRIQDADHLFEEKLCCLAELEENGFNVGALKVRLENLMAMKKRMVDLKNKKVSVDQSILEKELDNCRVEQKLMVHRVMIKELEDKLLAHQEMEASLIEEKAANCSDLSRLQSAARLIEESLLFPECSFHAAAVAPW